MITLMLHLRDDKFIEIEHRPAVVRGGEWGGGGYKKATHVPQCSSQHCL